MQGVTVILPLSVQPIPTHNYTVSWTVTMKLYPSAHHLRVKMRWGEIRPLGRQVGGSTIFWCNSHVKKVQQWVKINKIIVQIPTVLAPRCLKVIVILRIWPSAQTAAVIKSRSKLFEWCQSLPLRYTENVYRTCTEDPGLF